ncbi:MAG: hypothetical protein K0R27_4729 [Xanthobacteraceae bacterium]|nr:hypothetical protein [Xanthobacteraceae bacterium]
MRGRNLGRCLARLIGPFRLFDPAGRDITPKGRKTCGLISYLLLNEHARESRARLATILWSESDEEHARASLRQCIKELRNLPFGDAGELFHADKIDVAIDLARIDRDVDLLATDIRERNPISAARWLEAPEPSLLQGLDECDPLFDKWLQIRRSNWSEATVNELLGLVDEEDITSADEAVIAKSILKLDPFSERAAEIQMIALFETSGLQPAIAYFETYREHLAEEYEIEPSRKLLGLVDLLRERAARPTSRDARKAEPAVPARDKPRNARPETPTIAVIQAPSAQAGSYSDHIAGAFATELAATLGRFREWSVFRVEVESAEEIDKPDVLLERLASQGIEFAFFVEPPADAKSSDFHIRCHDSFTKELLVAERFRARPNEWTAVFNNMSARLASHLNVAIATARLHRSKKVSPDQQAAYDFWLDGQKLAIVWQPETEEAAIRCYERAIELAPQLPHAYSSLAAVLNSRWIVLPGWENDAADRDRALQLAQHALRLDNLDHRSQANLAWSHLLERRWDCAELHFRLAHDLNPANPSTLIAYALGSSFMGNHRQARQLCDRAFDICAIREPYFFGYRSTIAFLAGDYKDCLNSIEQVPDIFPDISGWAAASHALLGQKTEAAHHAGQFMTSMRERWAGQKPVSDSTLVTWFKTIFPLRRERDRKLLAEGMDRAVSYWMESDASAPSRSRRRGLSLDI